MDHSSQEREEENRKLTEKSEILGDLIYEADGKLLKSKQTEEAKGALFEAIYLRMALHSLETQMYRLRGQDYSVDYSIEYVGELQGTYKEVLDGKWVGAKKLFKDLKMTLDTTWEDADKLGLDRDFKFEGEKMFHQKGMVHRMQAGEDMSKMGVLLERFLDKQLELVPDETEPYMHPNFLELQAKVSFSV